MNPADWKLIARALGAGLRPRHAAERLVWNHYATNRAPNGGYGHHDFACDADVTWAVKVTCQEQPGSLICVVQVDQRGPSQPLPAIFLRRPAWADAVTIAGGRGAKLDATVEGGCLRLPADVGSQGGVRVTFLFSPHLEDRRLHRVGLAPVEMSRHRGVTFWNGPRILLANTERPRPAVVAPVGKDGCLRLPRDPNGDLRVTVASSVDASHADTAAVSKNGPHLLLAPWERLRQEAAAAFVFDLITILDE